MSIETSLTLPQSNRCSAQSPVHWMAPDACPGGDRCLSLSPVAEENHDRVQRAGDWRRVVGLALSLGICGGFWAGVGILLARLLR